MRVDTPLRKPKVSIPSERHESTVYHSFDNGILLVMCSSYGRTEAMRPESYIDPREMHGLKPRRPRFSRVWAMPNHETFKIPPIASFVHRYWNQSIISVDPFARNTNLATFCNDMNPNTEAEFHMEATEFMEMLAGRAIQADLVIVDPPYSPRQVKECYDSFGHKMKQGDALLGAVRKKLKAAINEITGPSGVVLHFGWNTVGMGKGLGFEQLEIMLVCHGSDHNDTICVAERRV
jgi:hypothetical protein